jgi:hypothetical protein
VVKRDDATGNQARLTTFEERLGPIGYFQDGNATMKRLATP